MMVAVEQEFTLKRFGKLRRKCVNAILDFMSDFSVNLYVGSSGGGTLGSYVVGPRQKLGQDQNADRAPLRVDENSFWKVSIFFLKH